MHRKISLVRDEKISMEFFLLFAWFRRSCFATLSMDQKRSLFIHRSILETRLRIFFLLLFSYFQFTIFHSKCPRKVKKKIRAKYLFFVTSKITKKSEFAFTWFLIQIIFRPNFQNFAIKSTKFSPLFLHSSPQNNFSFVSDYFLSMVFASALDDSPFTSNALMDEETLTHRPYDIKNVCSPYINV